MQLTNNDNEPVASVRKKVSSPSVKVKGWDGSAQDLGLTSFRLVTLLRRTSFSGSTQGLIWLLQLQPSRLCSRRQDAERERRTIHFSPLIHTFCLHPTDQDKWRTGEQPERVHRAARDLPRAPGASPPSFSFLRAQGLAQSRCLQGQARAHPRWGSLLGTWQPLVDGSVRQGEPAALTPTRTGSWRLTSRSSVNLPC